MGLIGVLIYELIRPFCGRWSGVLISTTASVYIQSGTAFVGYDYVYFALAFVLGSFVFLQKALSSDKHQTLTPTHQLFLSGVLMGCALSVKQTQGIAGISVGLFAVGLAYFLSDERGSIRKHCLTFSSGVVLVIAFWLFWALVKGVDIGVMMSQIFPRNGTKGSTFEIFFGTERDVFFAPNFGIFW
jgi:4-amino-4-deoxy-L-arabinose transferase-like glycosyltransferase